MSLAEFDADRVIDARDCIMGRVASQVAEQALAGDKIAIINAEQAVITGRKDDVLEKYQQRTELGSDQGPYYPRQPDQIFKRSIRGMLPMDSDAGREALENVRVYIENPFEADGEVLEETTLDRLSTIRFVELGEVSEQLGANKTW
ncbi:MAG: 50S ribosomal protein L13 [Halobacteriaceae archaeon]